jgi:hypothetical protein
MKRMIGIFVVLVLVTCSIYFIVANMIFNTVDTANTELVELLNERIVFKTDTLTIVDYSLFNNSVNLDNGTVMNADMARKLLINK